ncbi:MAG: hypothetical protein ACT4UP_03195 [Gammaproteobacteria bacterium]
MKCPEAIPAFIICALTACGDGGTPPESEAPPEAGAPVASGAAAAGGDAAFADHAAILRALALQAGPQGQVVNECGELVTPQFLSAELGGAVGTAILFAISGGPDLATCYGDGPGLHLMLRDGASWREIYAARGRMLAILPTTTGGVHDLADGGPGFSFPVWTWNGRVYVPAGREISDAELANANARYLP